jgi:hypothetical protein
MKLQKSIANIVMDIDILRTATRILLSLFFFAQQNNEAKRIAEPTSGESNLFPLSY